jgi:adenylate kinase
MLVLLGPPGAGKGTQAQILAERVGIPHLASGELLRAAVAAGTAIGREADRYMSRGQLVPDETIVAVFLDRLDRPDAKGGAILDGFPRTRPQAVVLDTALTERDARVARALAIEVPADELVRRLSGRWICAEAGHPYHADAHPPRFPGRCDIDGSPLVQREDDKPETIRARLAFQLGALREVIDHYRARSILRTVDGTQPIEDVTAALMAELPRAA